MILDAQNLHTFSQSRQIQVCNPTSVSFRRHFLVCSRAEHVKLVLCMQTSAVSSAHIPTSVNTKRGYACYDCCMLSSPAFVCMHAAL